MGMVQTILKNILFHEYKNYKLELSFLFVHWPNLYSAMRDFKHHARISL